MVSSMFDHDEDFVKYFTRFPTVGKIQFWDYIRCAETHKVTYQIYSPRIGCAHLYELTYQIIVLEFYQ